MAKKKPTAKPAKRPTKKPAKKLTLKEWFDNCHDWKPAHSLDTIRAGVAAGFLNAQDDEGMTALYLAVVSNWVEGVQELLRAGADTELRHHRNGSTALMNAVQNSTPEVVAALLAGGADLDAGNHYGFTPRAWLQRGGLPDPFPHIPRKPVTMPAPRIQNAEDLADHHWPHFKIPKREERESLKVGTAVNVYVYGPKAEGKQDTVKLRITKRVGRGANVRYTATVETPLNETHLPAGTTELEFGPENVATVYVPKKK